MIVLSFSGTGSISSIDSTWAATLEDTIIVGQWPIALASNPSDDNLYVTNFNSGNVSVIEP